MMIVVYACHLGKPVVICTDGRVTGGHHGSTLSWVYDVSAQNGPKIVEAKMNQPGVPGFHPKSKESWDQTPHWGSGLYYPFCWEEGKDWTRALESVLQWISRLNG
jgi:hypothetical protein